MSRVTELLGCEHPIIRGAMVVIPNPEMVAAVSEAASSARSGVDPCLPPPPADALLANPELCRVLRRLRPTPLRAAGASLETVRSMLPHGLSNHEF